MPPVNKLYGDLKGQGLAVLLISFREDPGRVKRAAQERGYVAPVLLDQSGEVAGKAYGVWAPPTAYFVDRQGRLVGWAAGPRNWESPAARRLVQDLLAQPAR